MDFIVKSFQMIIMVLDRIIDACAVLFNYPIIFGEQYPLTF